ncbi:MAG: hypothetical protein H5U38_03870 [Calditrichaeota bacterium]|nr:hypothetical protein [Calditrichota bacterium]
MHSREPFSAWRGWPRRLPFHFWLGVGLVAAAWPLNWSLPGMRTHLLFFPLWLGYCLAVDGLVVLCKGNSPLTRGKWAYGWLFLFSLVAWWLFELIDLRTQNWSYLGRERISDLGYAILASLSFSTVMPAVFTSAELVGCAFPARKNAPAKRRSGKGVLAVAIAGGCLMLALLLAWPGYFFAFVWLSLFFIFDPLNAWAGRPSLVASVAAGNWRPVWALWGGVMLCAFFWEMWNYYSYPKWVYRVPFVGHTRLFEMPLPGYLGYLPFALELYALFHFLAAISRLRSATKLLEL